MFFLGFILSDIVVLIGLVWKVVLVVLAGFFRLL